MTFMSVIKRSKGCKQRACRLFSAAFKQKATVKQSFFLALKANK